MERAAAAVDNPEMSADMDKSLIWNKSLNDAAWRCRVRVAGVWRARRLDQKQMSLFICDWAVLNALGNYEQFTRSERHFAIAHANGDAPTEDEEKVIRIVVCMPHEFAFNFYDHQVVAIELTDDARLPMARE
jgi:hypothetical protein